MLQTGFCSRLIAKYPIEDKCKHDMNICNMPARRVVFKKGQQEDSKESEMELRHITHSHAWPCLPPYLAKKQLQADVRLALQLRCDSQTSIMNHDASPILGASQSSLK
jgi:hypothetical protein